MLLNIFKRHYAGVNLMIHKKTKVSAVICDTYEIDQLQAKIKEAISLSGGFPPHFNPETKILIKPNEFKINFKI